MITKPNDGLLFWLFITCIEVTEDWNTTLTNSVGIDSATRWHRSESCFRLCWGVASYKSRDSSLMCLWISTPALSKFTSSYLGIITIKYVCVLIDWSCCVPLLTLLICLSPRLYLSQLATTQDVILLTSAVCFSNIQKTHFWYSSTVLHSWLKCCLCGKICCCFHVKRRFVSIQSLLSFQGLDLNFWNVREKHR